MTATTAYLHWLDAELDATANDLRQQAGPGLADAAERLTDLMVAKTMLREFIASQTPNTPANLTE
ncbi:MULTISPECIES: hypothetical protein [Giesbergeria]|uniref:Uncharacterized protein n=1 Tax=Giesbergeria sinuosa TaxID=80883 RepID=A0ABV9QDK4_9BURK